jgi:AraC family transcriptional regulator, alkane utilization regulator
MIETPPSFAETPNRPAGIDILSDMLGAIRLTGSVFLNSRFTAPFGVITPDRYDAGLPMARMRHISIFHLIASGACTVETASGIRHDVTAGDILLMPFAEQHRIWNGDVNQMVAAPSLFRQDPLEGIWSIQHGGGGAETRIVCGYIESSEFVFTPLFHALPELVVEAAGGERVGALIASTLREILALTDSATPGAQVMLGRLMELLFVEVLRRHVARMSTDGNGWFAALNDPIVGRALHSVHTDPGQRWTTESLARSAGTSRTVLTERFNALLGRPPIDYVTSWRIQLAAERLRSTNTSIARIASEAGYESEAAFNRAFKRVTGVTPGRWRDSRDLPIFAPAAAPVAEAAE